MNVLLTKKLSSSNLGLVKSWGWSFDTVNALQIIQLEVTELPVPCEAWVITSRNSWPATMKLIGRAPAYVYCIGSWMEEELKKNGIQSNVRSFDNINSLSVQLNLMRFRHVSWFCGDHHRHELEEILQGPNTTVSKIITHKSSLTFPIISKSYDAIFVFSPRSAESLLKNNTFPPHTIFACIGPTTEAYLKAHGISNTFCASWPDSNLLLQEFHENSSEH